MAKAANSDKNPYLYGVQEVLTANLDKLGINSGEHLGNSTTGQSDGKLGGRTSRALEKLVLLAQLDSGVKPEDAKSEFSTKNIQLVEAYLKKRQIDDASISKVITNLTALSAKDGNAPSFLDKHYTTGQVDVKTLKVPEAPKPAEAPKPSPESAKTEFDKKAPPAIEKKTDPATGLETPAPPPAPPKGTTVKMTYSEYKDIKEKVDDGEVVSREDKAAMKAFETAYEKLKADTGYTKVKKEYDDAVDKRDHGSKYRAEMTTEKTNLENSVQKKIDTFESTKFDVTITVDGKKKTFEGVTKDQLDEKYGSRWWDGEEIKKVREAVDAEIEKLKDKDPTFRKDEKRVEELDSGLQNYRENARQAVSDLGFKERKLERDLKNTTLDVFIPDPAPKAPEAAAPAAAAPASAPAVAGAKP